MTVCSGCGAEVLEGALRCRQCGAPFEGRDARQRLRPTVKPAEKHGSALSFSFEPDTDSKKPPSP